MPRSLTSPLRTSLLLTTLLAACGPALEDEPEDLESQEAAISANEVMSRANDYMTHDIMYCGGPAGGADLMCGNGICHPPAGPWSSHRSDCSGFVSYCWQISSDPDTRTFVNDRAGSQGWTTIGVDQLRPGDALVTVGHIKLFGGFLGGNSALIYEQYDCGRTAHKEAQFFSRSGNTVWFGGDSRAYHAIRRNGLSDLPSLSSRRAMAFQANTTSLWTVVDGAAHDWRLGMMPGTSPAIAVLDNGGYAVAFQANTGELWTAGSIGVGSRHLGMMRGTSPAITALPGGGYQIAFQANTSSLWTTGTAGTHNWELGMMPGTNPSIAALSGGGFQAAFQANTSSLWTVGSAGTRDWALGMNRESSPSITGLAGGGFQVAFEANTNHLWTAGTAGTKRWDLGMMPGTSPSITGLAGGGFQVAFEANTSVLWTAGTAGIRNWEQGMMRGSSPSIVAFGTGYEVAFEANTTSLITVGTAGNTNWHLGMFSGTNPSGG
ncbi:MAG: hypothetical protein IPJ65_28850 [Archangiaceae bacterium]|nr:hypothetical protein [Archangiaceae bacterium]